MRHWRNPMLDKLRKLIFHLEDILEAYEGVGEPITPKHGFDIDDRKFLESLLINFGESRQIELLKGYKRRFIETLDENKEDILKRENKAKRAANTWIRERIKQ